MNLLEASRLIRRKHVEEAARQLAAHDDFAWLYEQTGRREPDHRYIVVEGRRYPSKAFGFFVAQIAGNTDNDTNDMNVNQAVAPLLRLGYREIRGPGRGDTADQRAARRESYYRALARPQQSIFRQRLLDAYDGRCAITGCDLATVLEAAHVVPFRANGADTVANGLLLRIDLHRLFDADELAINPATMQPTFSTAASDYLPSAGTALHIPKGGPKDVDFRRRWITFKGEERV